MKPSTAQSALHPAADSGAELIDRARHCAVRRRDRDLRARHGARHVWRCRKGTTVNARKWVIGGGLVFPCVTLTALLMYSLAVGNGLSAIGARTRCNCFSIASACRCASSQVAGRVDCCAFMWSASSGGGKFAIEQPGGDDQHRARERDCAYRSIDLSSSCCHRPMSFTVSGRHRSRAKST